MTRRRRRVHRIGAGSGARPGGRPRRNGTLSPWETEVLNLLGAANRAQALMTAIHYGLARYSGTASYAWDHSHANRVIGTFRPRVADEAVGRTGAALCRFRPRTPRSAA
jgi:hypothetical protein